MQIREKRWSYWHDLNDFGKTYWHDGFHLGLPPELKRGQNSSKIIKEREIALGLWLTSVLAHPDERVRIIMVRHLTNPDDGQGREQIEPSEWQRRIRDAEEWVAIKDHDVRAHGFGRDIDDDMRGVLNSTPTVKKYNIRQGWVVDALKSTYLCGNLTFTRRAGLRFENPYPVIHKVCEVIIDIFNNPQREERILKTASHTKDIIWKPQPIPVIQHYLAKNSVVTYLINWIQDLKEDKRGLHGFMFSTGCLHGLALACEALHSMIHENDGNLGGDTIEYQQQHCVSYCSKKEIDVNASWKIMDIKEEVFENNHIYFKEEILLWVWKKCGRLDETIALNVANMMAVIWRNKTFNEHAPHPKFHKMLLKLKKKYETSSEIQHVYTMLLHKWFGEPAPAADKTKEHTSGSSAATTTKDVDVVVKDALPETNETKTAVTTARPTFTPENEAAEKQKEAANCPPGALRIKPGKKSLSIGLQKAKKQGIDTIFLEAGVHNERDSLVIIDFPIAIIGAGLDVTFIKAFSTKTPFVGIKIKGKKANGKVILKAMTVCKSKRVQKWGRDDGGYGLYGCCGMHFQCIDMKFAECAGDGVKVDRTSGTLINCVVEKCGYSGLNIQGGTLQVSGERTKITGCCTDESSSEIHYGMCARKMYGGGKIVIHSPLTKERISTNNGGGGNWNTIGTFLCRVSNLFFVSPGHL